MSEFHFLRPYFLLLLVFPILVYAYVGFKGRIFSSWEKICNKQILEFLSIKNSEKNSKINLWLFIIGLVFAIFAASGPSWHKREVVNMNQENAAMLLLDLSSDMSPQDLEKSKFDIIDLLKDVKALQVGLVVYSQEPFLITPITEDKALIESLLPQINHRIMPVNGLDVNRAIDFAMQKLKDAGFVKGNIIILSPSVENFKNAQSDYKIWQVSDSSMAKIIAALKQSNGELKQSKNSQVEWLDMGYYFMFVPLLVCLYFFRNGIFVFALLFSFNANAGLFLNSNQEGLKAFNQGDFALAEQKFRDKDWKASAIYKKGDFAKSINMFSDSYNQGNALAKAGKIEDAIAKYEELLKKEPNHEDAKFNLEYLKKQQSQNQQNQQSQGSDNQDSQQNQSNQNQPNEKENRSEEQKASKEQQEQLSETKDKPENAEDQEDQSQPDEFEKTEDDNKEYDEKAQAREQQYREIPEDVGGLLRAFIAKEYNKKRY